MDFGDIEPLEITFKESLFSSEFSEIFLVDVRGKTCVMKVHHNRVPFDARRLDRDINLHVCELSAYRRLQEHGICDRGFVPQFYGAIEHLDPSRYQPHLDAFVTDERAPSAIFLEYIPNMESINPLHYTKKRENALIRGIQEIHKALIYHSDPKPRNIMILKDHPERVIWLDFDRAQTYNERSITKRENLLIEQEERMMSQFMKALRADHKKGEIDKTYGYYCT